jgi:hypothetical protein
MSVDVGRPAVTIETNGPEVDDLVASLRPRLTDLVGADDVDKVIREAAADLGPVRVTTYLPILIERRVRQARRRPPGDEVRVTA